MHFALLFLFCLAKEGKIVRLIQYKNIWILQKAVMLGAKDDELQSAVSSQHTLVVFMTGEGMEETSVERVTTAVS